MPEADSTALVFWQRALRELRPDPSRGSRVDSLVLERDAGRFEMLSGTLHLLSAVDGRTFGAVFSGDGHFMRAGSEEHPEDYQMTVYNKGAWVLHMLRNLMTDLDTGNDDAFTEMMRTFYTDHLGGTASSPTNTRRPPKGFSLRSGSARRTCPTTSACTCRSCSTSGTRGRRR